MSKNILTFIEIRKDHQFFDSFSEEEDGIPWDNIFKEFYHGQRKNPDSIFELFYIKLEKETKLDTHFVSLILSINSVLDDAFSRVDCHVCDEDNLEVKFNGLSDEMKNLYLSKENIFNNNLLLLYSI